MDEDIVSEQLSAGDQADVKAHAGQTGTFSKKANDMEDIDAPLVVKDTLVGRVRYVHDHSHYQTARMFRVCCLS